MSVSSVLLRVRTLLALLVLAFWLPGFALAQTSSAQAAPESPASIGTYFRATFGTFQGQQTQASDSQEAQGQEAQDQEAIVTLENGDVVNALVASGGPVYHPGQAVIVWQSAGQYVVQDVQRAPALGWLLGLLVALAGVLGRWKGLRAIIGAGASLAVLVWLIVPRLAGGGDFLPTALLGTVGILCVTIYFVHGVGRKTTAALIGTAVTATFGFFLAVLAARVMGFTGTVSEGGYVASTLFGLNPLGVYLVGIVIGTVGALNDVTVTQAAVVQALAHENPQHGRLELYRRAMVVGFDHIGSLVNVLVLLYAAGSIPLLLLLDRDPTPLWVKLSGEGFASEITSILISTICLLLAVPLTTSIAAQFFQGGKHAPSGHAHVH
ncbi:YibE/F family protein [Deinococcus altitudinis]|uniref:YibE/F family protein n=1 Tax=Deinococcus altitudinis TaxID=468914 RepID=UPI003892BCB8